MNRSARFPHGALPRLFLAWMLLAATALPAMAAELEATFSDGRKENLPVTSYEGVEYLTLRNLERLLLQVDEGAQIERQYYPHELRILVQGKSITISDDFMVVAGSVFRPQNNLRTVSGELFIPIETLEEINNSLGLLSMQRPGLSTPLAATPTPPPATFPVVTPPELIETPPPVEIEPLPAIEPDATQPVQTPSTVSPSLNTLLGQANVPELSRIAIVAFSADRRTYGENADTATLITERTAERIREALESGGQFTVSIPERPWSSQTLQETVDWINAQQCDALIALTVDATPFDKEQGVRLLVAHEAADASARQMLAVRRGLPQKLNYLPYENQSTLLARLLHEEISNSTSLSIKNVELAPLYLLKRVALPSVEISLGSVTSKNERNRMVHGRFTDEVAKIVSAALTRMQQSVQESN